MTGAVSHEIIIESQSKITRLSKRANPSILGRTLVAFFLIGLHANPFEMWQPIPFLLSMFAGGFLLLLHAESIPKKEIKWISVFLLMALISTILAPRPEYLLARIRSLSYLVASVLIAFALYIELKRWPRKTLARWAGGAALILLVGATLEVVFEPVKTASDAYRFINFRLPYANDERDLLYHGAIRPKFFSSEPSYLGKHFAVMLICWLFATNQKGRFLLFMLATAIAVFVMRSPTLLLLPIAAALYLVSSFKRGKGILKINFKLLLGIVAAITVVVVYIILFWDVIGTRLAQIVSGEDQSTAVRLIISFAIIPKLLVFNPVTGIGVGGAEAFAEDVILESYSGIALIRQMAAAGRLEYLIMNSIAQFIITFGLLGGAVALWSLIKLQQVSSRKRGFLFWMLLLAFALTEGALNGLKLWSVFFVLLVYSSVFQTTKNAIRRK
ncbi:hypothetical protein [Rhodothermus profundi]|nr:hypothetical protein [Rhodothermus profundi]